MLHPQCVRFDFVFLLETMYLLFLFFGGQQQSLTLGIFALFLHLDCFLVLNLAQVLHVLELPHS